MSCVSIVPQIQSVRELPNFYWDSETPGEHSSLLLLLKTREPILSQTPKNYKIDLAATNDSLRNVNDASRCSPKSVKIQSSRTPCTVAPANPRSHALEKDRGNMTREDEGFCHGEQKVQYLLMK